jgi:hypothetical protein
MEITKPATNMQSRLGIVLSYEYTEFVGCRRGAETGKWSINNLAAPRDPGFYDASRQTSRREKGQKPNMVKGNNVLDQRSRSRIPLELHAHINYLLDTVLSPRSRRCRKQENSSRPPPRRTVPSHRECLIYRRGTDRHKRLGYRSLSLTVYPAKPACSHPRARARVHAMQRLSYACGLSCPTIMLIFTKEKKQQPIERLSDA